MDKSIKISIKNYEALQRLSLNEGRSFKFLIDKAVENYLKSKKVLK